MQKFKLDLPLNKQVAYAYRLHGAASLLMNVIFFVYSHPLSIEEIRITIISAFLGETDSRLFQFLY